jgi:hypothetical protein
MRRETSPRRQHSRSSLIELLTTRFVSWRGGAGRETGLARSWTVADERQLGLSIRWLRVRVPSASLDLNFAETRVSVTCRRSAVRRFPKARHPSTFDDRRLLLWRCRPDVQQSLCRQTRGLVTVSNTQPIDPLPRRPHYDEYNGHQYHGHRQRYQHLANRD